MAALSHFYDNDEGFEDIDKTKRITSEDARRAFIENEGADKDGNPSSPLPTES